MNTDIFFILIPALTIFLTLMGIYKITLEKKIRAREFVQDVVGTAKKPGAGVTAPGMPVVDEKLLKRRLKAGEKQTFSDRIETDLERANMLLRPNEYLGICLGMVVVVFLMAVFLFGLNIFLGLLAGVAGFFLPILYLKIRVMMRMGKAEEQFADVLDALVNCFKTGFAFSRAIQMIADNFEDPWGTEFGKMLVEMNLGATLEQSLQSLARRVPLTDVELFVAALVIQKETGGNLAELLATLSNTCRERFKLYRKIDAISAQGKLSACIIICVPFGLMGLIYLFLPGPVTSFVTNPIGMVALGVSGFWMACGIGVLWKIVQIEV